MRSGGLFDRALKLAIFRARLVLSKVQFKNSFEGSFWIDSDISVSINAREIFTKWSAFGRHRRGALGYGFRVYRIPIKTP
jgi:hypothetical protein